MCVDSSRPAFQQPLLGRPSAALSFTFPRNFREIPAFPGYFRDFGAEMRKSQKGTEKFPGFCLGMYIYRNAYTPTLRNFLLLPHTFPSDCCSRSLAS